MNAHFSGNHATRALAHAMKTLKSGILACTADIPADHAQQ
jgi:hypothetical protein